MTDRSVLSDDEKRQRIDLAPVPGGMELKVGGEEALSGQADHGGQGGEGGQGAGAGGCESRLLHDMGPQAVIHNPPGEINGHISEGTAGKGDSVYDFDPDTEGEMPSATEEDSLASPDKHSERSETTDSNVKHEPELETLDDSEMVGEESLSGSFHDDVYPIEPPMGDTSFGDIPRRGRGRPRGSKNRIDDGRGRGRGFKFRRMSEDRTCTAYDLRNIPDPFANQRRGRPRSRFIVDLGEQNHEAWAKSKEELNISDAELTTLLLSL